jgi:hypothetical protein
MKLIEKFFCVQTEIFGDGSEKTEQGLVTIKTELLRPSIRLMDSNGNIIPSENSTVYRKKLIVNPFVDNDEYFNKEELFFLSKIYEFDIKEDPKYKGYFSSVLNVSILYKNSADIILIEDDGKECLIIEFNRWSTERQPRSAGEDQLGEDITYIHGIWENPLLTDEIIAKIKNKRQ